jgi:hypothetical protein
MENIKSLNECKGSFEINKRLKELRRKIVKESNGLLTNIGENNNSIYVDWNWINRIEIRLDSSDFKNVILEIWIADVKHQWKDLSKKSSMMFLKNKDKKIQVFNFEAKKFLGAYVKIGNTFGQTLKWADINNEYVEDTFNKDTYKNFYNTIGGQWTLNVVEHDYVNKNYKLLNELEKMKLVENDKNEIIKYVEEEVENQTKAVLNLSLGTTLKIFIPLEKLKEKDVNYNYEQNIDELAIPILNIIKSCKKEIEE